MRSLFAIFLLTLLALRAAEGPAEFLFPEDNRAAEAKQLANRRGEQAMADHLYMNAANYFREYCAAAGLAEPDASLGHARLANALLLAGHPAAALQEIDRWLATPGANPPPAEKLQLQLFRGQALLSLKRPAEAIPILEEVAKAPVDSAVRHPAVRLLTDHYMKSREWSRAIALLAPKVNDYRPEDPRRTDILLPLAQACLVAQRFPDARKALQPLDTASKSLPQDTALQVKLLLLQCDTGEQKLSDGWKHFQEIAPKCPKTPSHEWWSTIWPLALACSNAGKPDLIKAAIGLFQYCLGVAGNDDDRLKTGMKLAEAQVAVQATDDAKRTLQELLDKFPKAPEFGAIRMRLAELKRDTRDRESAAEEFRRLAADAAQPAAMRYRAAMQAADCLVQVGKLPQATECYRLASTLGESTAQKAEALLLAAEKTEQDNHLREAIQIYREIADKHSAAGRAAADSRLEAGRLLNRIGDAAGALAEFQNYIRQNPDSPRIWEARLAAGRAQAQLAGNGPADNAKAEAALMDIARQCPQESLATDAFLAACQCALRRGDRPRAIAILQDLLKRFPKGAQVQFAMHRAIILCFQLGRDAEAISLGQEYLQRFPGSRGTAEVALLLADNHAANSDYAQARELYLRVVAIKDATGLAALARYEAARCAHLLKNPSQAVAELQPLLAEDNPLQATPHLRANAAMLAGDLAAEERNTDSARAYFSQARQFAGDTPLGYAAIARQAEMLLSVADPAEVKKDMEECLKVLQEHSREFSSELAERTKLLHARWFTRLAALAETDAERNTHRDKARQYYERIYNSYTSDVNNGIPHSPRHFYPAAWEFAHLLELKGDPDAMRHAMHVYEALAASGLPRADEAARRAAELRRNYHLGL